MAMQAGSSTPREIKRKLVLHSSHPPFPLGVHMSVLCLCPYFCFANRLIYAIFLVTETVKNLPAIRETWVSSLGWEDPLEEGMATHSSILAWRIPMDREAWKATVHGVTKSQTQLSD